MNSSGMTYKDYDKIIFVHIPRTGGNSIRRTLEGVFGNHKNGSPLLSHHAYLDFFNPTEKSFSFSFVRNPYDICISFYNYHVHTLSIRQIKKFSFKDWVKEDFYSHWKEASDEWPNIPVLQHPYIYKDEKLAIDFLGKHENLVGDFQKLMDILGLENIELQNQSGNSPSLTNRYNKFKNGNQKTFDDYYDSETIEMVNEKLSKDFELFGYEKINP